METIGTYVRTIEVPANQLKSEFQIRPKPIIKEMVNEIKAVLLSGGRPHDNPRILAGTHTIVTGRNTVRAYWEINETTPVPVDEYQYQDESEMLVAAWAENSPENPKSLFGIDAWSWNIRELQRKGMPVEEIKALIARVRPPEYVDELLKEIEREDDATNLEKALAELNDAELPDTKAIAEKYHGTMPIKVFLKKLLRRYKYYSAEAIAERTNKGINKVQDGLIDLNEIPTDQRVDAALAALPAAKSLVRTLEDYAQPSAPQKKKKAAA